jgi:hypothetical protein
MYLISLHPQRLAALVTQILDHIKVSIVRAAVQATSAVLSKHT